MKKGIFVILFLIFSFNKGFGQSLDSIKYANGYIYFHTYGNGEPVVLLSGGPGNNCQQIEDVAIAVGKNHKAILLEQRGTGLSIPKPMDATTITLKSAMDDINGVLQHLGLKEAIFIGHSYGGTLAMGYATHFPEKVKSLILVGPGFYLSDENSKKTFDNNAKARLGEADIVSSVNLTQKQKVTSLSENEINQQRKILYKSYIYNKFAIDDLYPKLKRGTRNQLMYKLIWENLDSIKFDLRTQLPKFNKPITIISGLQDPLSFVTYELGKLLPRSETFWIQEYGHYPMYEQPEKFYKYLNMALSK